MTYNQRAFLWVLLRKRQLASFRSAFSNRISRRKSSITAYSHTHRPKKDRLAMPKIIIIYVVPSITYPLSICFYVCRITGARPVYLAAYVPNCYLNDDNANDDPRHIAPFPVLEACFHGASGGAGMQKCPTGSYIHATN